MSYMMLNFPDFAQQLQQAQQMQMMQQATMGGAMGGQPGEGMAPEDTTEPEQNLAQNPADAGLDQIQLPPM
jgi:hypothetical protein